MLSLRERGSSSSLEKMNPIVQEDRTGCGIASVAAIAGKRYSVVKRAANRLGIGVTDSKLWSETGHVRRLLDFFGVAAGERECAFVSWSKLPPCALLAIKWHREKNGAAWHWVVFVREENHNYVLDPKRSLRTNRRTDFGRMKPKWFIPLKKGAASRQGQRSLLVLL
jgi:hypothetical protein